MVAWTNYIEATALGSLAENEIPHRLKYDLQWYSGHHVTKYAVIKWEENDFVIPKAIDNLYSPGINGNHHPVPRIDLYLLYFCETAMFKKKKKLHVNQEACHLSNVKYDSGFCAQCWLKTHEICYHLLIIAAFIHYLPSGDPSTNTDNIARSFDHDLLALATVTESTNQPLEHSPAKGNHYSLLIYQY